MKTRKSNLDEQQEQKLLKIEHNGCWFVFWALLASMLIQLLVMDDPIPAVVGEWAVFMVLCIYLMVACLRAGIWDRHLSMSWKTNLVCSLIAGVFFAAFTLAVQYLRFGKHQGALLGAAIAGAVVTLLCFLALTLCARLVKKRQRALEEEPEDEDMPC